MNETSLPSPPLLAVRDLRIEFHQNGETIQAVGGVSFSLRSGETLAIVGESGSGKSVAALSLTRLLPGTPHCQSSGQVIYKGAELLSKREKVLRGIRGSEIAYIFQEPTAALNPVFTVGYQIAEAIRRHRPEVINIGSAVIDALRSVGIETPERRMHDFPHQMSGGMLQRVMIAMALASDPTILIADEPTTALDTTIQRQIMELFQSIKRRYPIAMILITHNFGIVKGFADRVLVMYRGKFVESGRTADLLRAPKHPYTRALLECIPRIGMKGHRLATIDYASLA